MSNRMFLKLTKFYIATTKAKKKLLKKIIYGYQIDPPPCKLGLSFNIFIILTQKIWTCNLFIFLISLFEFGNLYKVKKLK